MNIRYLSIIFFLLISSQSLAAVSLKIDKQDIPKVKILFSSVDKKNFNNESNNNAKFEAERVINKVKSNLYNTDLFEVVTTKNNQNNSSEDNDLSIEQVPNFLKYQNKGLEMLVVIEANFTQSQDLEIKIRLWDIEDQKQLFGKFYSASSNNYKKISNLISDEIFKATTGEKVGFFDSKITYIAESGSTLKRVKRIATMDFDGQNLQYLTNGRDLVLTPAFIKQNNEILFVRFFNEKPQIYSLDIQNNLLRKVGSFKETTFAPTINPKDNRIIAFSLIENGNSNIYEANLVNNQNSRLTNTKAIDTTPSYSPDGNYIVFSSDRSGSQQIYMMNNQGRDIRKISNGSGNYSKPVWSPDGKFIAFTKMSSNKFSIKNSDKFSIGIMDVDGRNEKTLTSGYLVEGAKWSPSSRYLIYSRKSGPYGQASIPKLWIIDTLTGFERQVPTPKNEGASDPDWVMN